MLRWTLFNGGTKEANVREQQRRADEVHARLFERTRRAEEDTRTAWSRLTEPEPPGRRSSRPRAAISDDLLLSYREQFNVGRRSLLDVLDAQNTRYNVQAQTETARLAKLYAQYRVLAATNRLIEALGVADADRGLQRRARRASASTRSRRRTCRKTACRIRDGPARIRARPRPPAAALRPPAARSNRPRPSRPVSSKQGTGREFHALA